MLAKTIRLTPHVSRTLDRLSRALGKTHEELIEEGLARLDPAPAPPRPKGLGGYQSGRTDISECAEDILRAAAREAKWQ